MALHAPTRHHHYHAPRIHLSAHTATNAAWTALASAITVLVVLYSQQVAPIAEALWHGLVAWGMVMAGIGVLWLGFLTSIFVQ
jgi:hypothetical protein